MTFLRTLLCGLALALTFAAAPASAEPTEGFAPNVRLSDLGASVPGDPIVYADGAQGSLRDFAGEVLVVTLWQEHCPYCRTEMPKLDRLSADMAGEGVRVIALGLDQDMALIERYLENEGYDNITPVMDVDKFNGSLLSVEHFGRLSIATPTTFIVDPEGVVAATVWGLTDWDGAAARDYLRSLAQG